MFENTGCSVRRSTAVSPLAWLAAVGLLGACRPGTAPGVSQTELSDPGALVSVTYTATVGVNLDDIEPSQRANVFNALAAKPDSFWQARAIRQANLTTYRLVFRAQFYPKQNRQQLPLPPAGAFNISFSHPARHINIDGHDIAARDYTYSGTLLTTTASPGITEPKLAHVAGQRIESFVLPVDPELVFQRTRFACMDEAEFPPLSVDSEEVDSFYDDSCTVESQLTQTGCHQTELPTMSCQAALKASIGRTVANVTYTRLAWNQALADQVRVGPVANTTGANLTPESSEFRVNRLTYRYITPDSCALSAEEGPCVGGAGWRRLLQFATADRNTGQGTLTIGPVDYFNADGGSILSQHNEFQWSSCHKHYHFRHYGSFHFTTTDASDPFNTLPAPSKRGFCLQSTDRFSNNEFSPLNNPFADCGYQGIEVGWVDEYKAGLLCQWKDVTSIKTADLPVTGTLAFHTNPDGFLCEGTEVTDSNGQPVFGFSGWCTQGPNDYQESSCQSGQQPIDIPQCNYYSTPTNPNAWDADNSDAYDVTIPVHGEGYVTAPCTHDQIGPLRNCQFAQSPVASCTPGQTTQLTCTLSGGTAPQVVRVCEASRQIGAGTACTYQDSLANNTVDSGGATFTFTCPAARDAIETGGSYALYFGPAWNEDPSVTVNCTAH
jgi:hypothetical protein